MRTKDPRSDFFFNSVWKEIFVVINANSSDSYHQRDFIKPYLGPWKNLRCHLCICMCSKKKVPTINTRKSSKSESSLLKVTTITKNKLIRFHGTTLPEGKFQGALIAKESWVVSRAKMRDARERRKISATATAGLASAYSNFGPIVSTASDYKADGIDSDALCIVGLHLRCPSLLSMPPF